ncbi:S26 family signal peptidase [Microbacterium sp. M3]|uniref:S26 family signal peptidase n=1 Tax=Microbacterium arthrosphaerae TaxID=792652 RepID=A0ABU4H327_9MICO|nr:MULTISPECIES: S26 family signal peptidase [Microbacterium]MDW4573738.1 S26 family signal peptidase [Microbacterium arthrosphaerae]MDW7607593.1 S26 family signal peptidase [Microbacterium sp. M3]
MARRRRSAWATAGDAALTVAAVLGAVCIVLAIAAAVFDVRIVLFRTGSMSPTIPAGSAAIVHAVPAGDIAVGDVIMVDRPGDLPVTHRVVGIESVPGAREARRLTMRGDANAVDDPLPYTVTEARRVVLSVPGVAPVLGSLGSPWVLGSITVAATVHIVAVFWPRRERPTSEGARDGSAETGVVAGVEVDGPVPVSAPVAASARRKTGGTALVVGLLAAGVAAGSPTPARAASDETVIQGAVIRLVSIEEPAMQQLTPGATAVWQVGVMADAASPGTLTVTLSGAAAAPTALRYEVRGCSERWTGDMCPTPDPLVEDSPVPTTGDPVLLQTMPDDEQLWLRIAVMLPSDADPVVSPVQLTVRATGVGDDVTTGAGGGLAATGGGARWGLPAAGIVALAVGAGLVLRLRRRP